MDRFIRKSLKSGEEVVMVGQMHWTYKGKTLICAVALGALAVTLFVIALNMAGRISIEGQRQGEGQFYWYDVVKWIGYIALFSAFALYGWGRYTLSRAAFAVTRSKLLVKQGIFGAQVTDIPLHKVEKVELKQSFLQRATGSGSLVLSGKGGMHFVLNDVMEPEEVRDALLKYKLQGDNFEDIEEAEVVEEVSGEIEKR